MVSCTYFALGLAALFAAFAAVTSSDDWCSDVRYGSMDGVQVPLPQTIIQPGVREAQVYLPEDCVPDDSQIGIFVHACDVDASPTVQLVNDRLINVHRNGNLNGNAIVAPALICSY